MKLKQLTEFLDKYLETDQIDDFSWNGLQFEGKTEVKKALFAVDAGIETFLKAASTQSDIVIVHHGHFWKNQNPSINSWSKKRIDILFKNGISLYACHLPLDRHREVGNNAQIIKILGGEIGDEFLLHKGKNIGWFGDFQPALSLDNIVGKLQGELNAECKVMPFGKDKITKAAVCSGGGGYGGFYEALEKGADLYITGDTAEIYYTAKDAGMNVIFAGHHTTETIGLQALKKVISDKFNLECIFVDMPTGL